MAGLLNLSYTPPNGTASANGAKRSPEVPVAPAYPSHHHIVQGDARHLHLALYDSNLMKPSKMGIDYLLPIFTDAIGNDDAEHPRQTLFNPGNLTQPYHSINTDVNKRIRYLEI